MPRRPSNVPPRGPTIGSVEKAVSLLKILGNGLPEAGVSELARRLNVHKSTASRLLATLERGGLVERDSRTEKYRLGFEIVRLAGQVPRRADLIEIVRPILEWLSTETGETINLALPDDDGVINIYQISSPHFVNETNWVGRRTPYHCVANGKALLAWRTETEIARALVGRLERFTAKTIATRKALLNDLARACKRGYATALEELEIGLNAIAAPIRDAHGEVIAAVSVSGPAYRVTSARVPALGAQSIEAARRISQRLGWSGG
jgi:DNA-binding IclR family transcriptional regulator